jgi:hypothetical protein
MRVFYSDGGRMRGVPVTIGGTSYISLLPMEDVVMENLQEIIQLSEESIYTAIKLCLYCMKTKIFNDGNQTACPATRSMWRQNVIISAFNKVGRTVM